MKVWVLDPGNESISVWLNKDDMLRYVGATPEAISDFVLDHNYDYGMSEDSIYFDDWFYASLVEIHE